jgi:hypothetical protein
VVKERKEKPQKGWKNARFFGRHPNQGLKQGFWSASALFWVCFALYYARNFTEKTSKAMKEFSDWHELEQHVSAAVKLGRRPVAVAFPGAASRL